ncbi:MAG TPA: ABC transporter ATP-binding protein [Vicinamibacterales bacterium]|nr:ABC transporter ATP-binding protein [Vicinamibacterales bacterium]
MRVTITNLRKSYGRAAAVDDLSLEIASGALFALVGPSGSGKTTVLRCLAGLEYPDAGTIAFDGRDVSRVPPPDRHVSVVFQSYALYPHLTVYENVAFGLIAHAYRRAGLLSKAGLLARRLRSATLPTDDSDRIREMLSLVELQGYDERRPAELSGGQQQRVALARALVTRPRLLLMDEPLGALDARLRERMLELIHAVHARLPITTVYVTHDQREAALLADQAAIVHDGRLEQAGPFDELRATPRNPFVADFLGTRGSSTVARSAKVDGGETP